MIPFTLPLAGMKMSFRNVREFYLLYKSIFREQEYYFETNSKKPFIVDCGSHIGLATLYFKKMYPKASIVAFEPNRANSQIFKQNVELNNLEGVVLHEVAVAEYKGDATFYQSKKPETLLTRKIHHWSWSDSLKKNGWFDPSLYKEISVKTRMLSSILTQPVDLLKLDIEGAETVVLREAQDKLSLVKQIVMEYHGSLENKENNLEEILRILEKCSFTYELEQNGEEILVEDVQKTNPYWLMIRARRTK